MASLDFQTGDIVRHYKGNLYMVLGYARHTETNERLVLYRRHEAGYEQDGITWARPEAVMLETVEGDQRRFILLYREH